MATKTYFEIDGAPGDSLDQWHQGSFEVVRWSFGTGGGQLLYISLLGSAATGALDMAMRTGRIFRWAEMKEIVDGGPKFTLRFHDLQVVETKYGGMLNARTIETIAFRVGAKTALYGSA